MSVVCRALKVAAGKKQWEENRVIMPSTKHVAAAKSDEENLVDPKLDNHGAIATTPDPAVEQ